MTIPPFSPGTDLLLGSNAGPSFTGLLREQQLLPSWQTSSSLGGPLAPAGLPTLVHATTIVAMCFADGVVMAGDRRATAGNVIANRAMDKVFPADRHSGVSISGVAGVAAEMVKLFQLELEHYEKVEGVPLSLPGKATRLSAMIRNNLPMAMQAGMVVIPIFAGYDLRRRIGRIYNYDVTGGQYEEAEFYATGSGGVYANGVIRMRWRRGMTADEVVDIAIEALFEAADQDSATGGPDAIRGIYPSVATITAEGFESVPEESIAARFAALIERKRGVPGTTVPSDAPRAVAP